MYTIELKCEANHFFEGWYDSEADYAGCLSRSELLCPLCDSEFVMRRSSTESATGKALMDLARKIKSSGQAKLDRSGALYFKLRLD